MTDDLILIGTDGRRFECYETESVGRRVAEQQAALELREREAVTQDNDRLRARLRALGIDPDA